jgi:hypothetical protein
MQQARLVWARMKVNEDNESFEMDEDLLYAEV